MSTAIECLDVSKKYKIYKRPFDRVKEVCSPGRKKYHEDFWALKEIDFSVSEGEVIGIIGANGGGKSTLLQIVGGMLRPTVGCVRTSGRVSALLDLGGGFNPEFSGIENIFLTAGIYGFSGREARTKLDAIVDFADIGPFIERPVKLYSHGMFLRLAFAIAVSLDAEVILIDEVLAVGDILFQQKCYEKIREFREEGKTILLTSHNTDEIKRVTNRCLLLHEGRIVMDGEPWPVTESYHKMLNELKIKKHLAGGKEGEKLPMAYAMKDESFYTEEASLAEIRVMKDGKEISGDIQNGAQVEIITSIHCHKPLRDPRVGVFVTDLYGYSVSGTSTIWNGIHFDKLEAGQMLTLAFKMTMNLKPGSYFITVRLMEKLAEANYRAVLKLNRARAFCVTGEEKFYGLTDLNQSVELIELSSAGDSKGSEVLLNDVFHQRKTDVPREIT